MSLAAGTRLGPYEILAPIGAGGTGEVYRARDIKLGRDVAIKVLPEAFARDADRMARFEREAHVLASLNHPNIAAIYGLEESNGIRALVMELVEGRTLAERIGGRAMPLEEALPIAKQIADALEAAHEKGIVHRDLKPGNIKITPQGVVKVLDFGLAAVAQPSAAHASDPSASPTMTISPTRVGMILGTAAYMSPEQARGKVVDKRADIWSFGCVLYEMLTGKPAFQGETITDILAAVVKNEPDLMRVPPKMRRLIQACLQKDAKHRLQAVGDWGLLLEETPVTISQRKRTWVPWAAVSLLSASIAAWALLHSSRAEPRQVTRWTIPLTAIDPGGGFGISLSRDGTQMAYAERTAVGASQIMVRLLDQKDAKPIAGSEGGLRPFFSPDGRWLAYFAGLRGPLKKVAITGGTPVTLCQDAGFFGGTWGDDDRIIFLGKGSLMQVPASGGKCEIVSTQEREKGEAHQWPQTLPDGRSLLVTIRTGNGGRIAVLDRVAGTYRVLVENASAPRYVPSGHLVYVRDGTLFAAPFDLKRLTITGPEVPVIERIYFNATGGFADYSFSDSGLLLYIEETRLTSLNTLDWVDRKGTSKQSAAPPGSYTQALVGTSLRLSPDGLRAAITIRGNSGDLDVWVADLVRGTMSRLTSGGINGHPIWTPDGRRIAFFHNRTGEVRGIYWASANGSGKPEVLLDTSQLYALPDSWTPDARTLLYETPEPARIWSFTLPDGRNDGRPRAPFEETRFNERDAQLSPDGRWMLYVSDESGRDQVYGRPFPGPGSKVPISIDSGETPRWSGNGNEVFYLDPAKRQVMAVNVMAGASELRAGQPHVLFDLQTRDWDATPDGQRFLVRRIPVTEQNRGTLQVVVNWFDELRRRVPVTK